MNLTAENYHSLDANKAFMSYSQYLDFNGSLGRPGCHVRALAKLRGEWVEETSTAQLVGSYVDAHFEGTLPSFMAEHPELFKKNFELKAEYARAEEIINRIETDPLFMNFLSGNKQVILTAEIFGFTWKCKLDSVNPESFITDLKIMESIRAAFWVKDYGKINWIEYWGYDVQAAIYQKAIEIKTGKKVPYFIACASKEKVTDIEIIWIPQNKIDERIIEIEANIPRIMEIKSGSVEPTRCGVCDYCKSTKVLTRPIALDELIEKV